MTNSSAFLYRAGTILVPAGRTNHLHIICNNPVFYPIDGASSVLAVNISTVRESSIYDGTCILHRGDHPFVHHDSFVYYKDATILKVARADVLYREGSLIPKGQLSEDVFQRVLKGFFESEEVTPRIMTFVKDFCL